MMPPDPFALGNRRTTSSHTISLSHLSELLRFVPVDAPFDDYAYAVVEMNVLGRPTHAGRLRVLRHLRELYGLGHRVDFRLLRVLYDVDPGALPLLAGLLAVSQDEFLRASWPVLAGTHPGERVTSDAFATALAAAFDGQVAKATFAKAGRNIGASWTQTGHLVGQRLKIRGRASAPPAAVALALTLGYLAGSRGPRLLDTTWFEVLDVPTDERRAALDAVHRTGLIDVHAAGSVLEIDPTALLVRAGVLEGSGA